MARKRNPRPNAKPNGKKTSWTPYRRGAFIRHLQHQLDNAGDNMKLLPEGHGSKPQDQGSQSSSLNPEELKRRLKEQRQKLQEDSRWSPM